ncbi:MAG TPA: hypothetical protein VJZ76_11860 [Thermoanaerobaculia bacterium]|nr:hypothetical protein [Thermoanaerobaculia bacterium]
MKKILPLLLLAAAPAFGAGLRLFNPGTEAVDAVVVCDEVASRQSVAPNAIADVVGDCRVDGVTPLLVIHTDSIDGADFQSLEAAGTTECPAPAVQLALTGCRFGSAVATVAPVLGATYAWTIEGGTLLSGAGTERVVIGIGSGLVLKVTATIVSPSCGTQTTAGIMALRDPFVIKTFTTGSGAAGSPRTLTWSYDNGAPLAQVLTGSDFAAPITLSPSARSYTYTPSMYGDKNVVLQASTTPSLPGRVRAAGKGGAALASACTAVRAEGRYHVDCSTPAAKIEAPAATGVGIAFTARVKLDPGTTAAWTIANGTPSTATGDSVTIRPAGGDPVDVRVTVSADTCTATAAAQVRVDSKLGCATPPAAALSMASSDCDRGVINVVMSGTPPFAGTWSDGQPFSTADRAVQRTVTKAGDYTIQDFHDALCSGQAGSVKYAPTPTATISTNGVSCLTPGVDSVAILTFTGTPPFLGEWSDSVAFNTNETHLERKITAPGDLTLKWFQDAKCAGTVSGHAGFGGGGTASVKLASPANGCLMLGDPTTPAATAAVDLTGTPPFTVVWADGFVQTVNASPALRPFAPPPGATYPLAIQSARDAFCDLQIVNAATSVSVTKYPSISFHEQNVCPGTSYSASLFNVTGSSMTWRIDKGSIKSGQGNSTVVFEPAGTGGSIVNLAVDITDPATCTATGTKSIKIFPNAGAVTLTAPKSMKAGDRDNLLIGFNLQNTESVLVEVRAPNYTESGLCVVYSPCTFLLAPDWPGTIQITATGNAYCSALPTTHASLSIPVQ